MESMLALETAPLAAGSKGGGGVRVPPPRLLGPEDESAVEGAGAEEVVVVSLSASVPEEKETLSALEEEVLESGSKGGGGVRLPPPPLLAPADSLDAEDAGMESMLALETAPLAALTLEPTTRRQAPAAVAEATARHHLPHSLQPAAPSPGQACSP